MKIKFSIIITVYNREEYINACVYSVLKQTYQDYEIVLVDDGSTDESPKICDLFAEKNECISTFHQRNAGPILARMNGANRAKGDFLVFLDSDDMLRHDALEIIYNAIITDHADLVMYCASVSENYDKPFKQYSFHDNKVFIGKGKNTLYELICTSSTINEIALKCFRKSLFPYNTINKDVRNVRNGEDCLLSLPIIDKADTIVFVDSLIYYYRPNIQSMVHISNPKCFDSYRIVTERRLCYAQKWDTKCPGLLNKTKCFAGEQCYTAVRNVMTSYISWEEKVKEIEHIKESDFFKKYHKVLPKGFPLVKKVFYLMWLTNNLILSNCATMIYRSIR